MRHASFLPSPQPEVRSTTISGLVRWAVEIVVASVMSALAGFIGTFIHRSGVDGVFPWGLVLALFLLACVTWIARVFAGQIAVGFTLLMSSIVIWGLALIGTPQTSILVPIGSSSFHTWFSANAGFIWLFGSLILQVIIFFLPKAWFRNPFKALLLPSSNMSMSPNAPMPSQRMMSDKRNYRDDYKDEMYFHGENK